MKFISEKYENKKHRVDMVGDCKTMWRRIFILLFFAAPVCFGFSIDVKKPTYVFPQFSGEYRNREVEIHPKEYELADSIRQMLQKGNKSNALEKLNNIEDEKLSPALLLLKAQVLFDLKMHRESEVVYLKVLSTMPDLTRAHAELGQLYTTLEQPEKARKHFARAISLGDNSARIHAHLGYLNLKYHGPWSAISAYQQALSLEPSNIQWQHGLLTALTQAKMNDSALALVDEMLQKQPESQDLWLSRASILIDKGDTLRGLSSLEISIRLGHTENSTVIAAVQLNLQHTNYDRATELLNRQLSNSKIDMDTLDRVLAWLYQEKQSRHGFEVLEKVNNKLDYYQATEQSVYYQHMANFSGLRKDNENAENYYEKSLEFDPANGSALMAFANHCVAQKQYVKAELLFDRAAVLDRFNETAIKGKANLYITIGNYSSALEILKKHFKKHPEDYQVKEIIRALERVIDTKIIATS